MTRSNGWLASSAVNSSSTQIAPSLCPSCGYAFTKASPLDCDVKPKEHDFSLCISCGALLCFTADLRLVKPTEADLADFREKQPDDYRGMKKAQALLIARGPIRRPTTRN